MILANNKTRGQSQLFNNMRVFNQACEFHELEIIDDDYTPGKAIDSGLSDDIEGIEVIEITPNKININEYSVPKFRDNIKNFSKEDLQVFIDTDSRVTMKREAKKELKKRK